MAKKRVMGLIFFLAIIVFIIIAAVSCNTSHKPSVQMPAAGDNAVFAQTSSNLVTTNETTFSQLNNFAQQNNQSAIQNMINSGEVSMIPVGTKVEVLQTGWNGGAEIQVMSGAFKGDDLYTFLNALSKAN